MELLARHSAPQPRTLLPETLVFSFLLQLFFFLCSFLHRPAAARENRTSVCFTGPSLRSRFKRRRTSLTTGMMVNLGTFACSARGVVSVTSHFTVVLQTAMFPQSCRTSCNIRSVSGPTDHYTTAYSHTSCAGIRPMCRGKTPAMVS